MVELTVGYVAGLVALGVLIGKSLCHHFLLFLSTLVAALTVLNCIFTITI